MDINFELYKVFYIVAKNRNITKAANELMISQPAISKSIKNLEEGLHCKLFIRTSTGVLLTDEGSLLYHQIKQAMEIIESAEDKIKEVVNLQEGVLRIGVSNTLTKRYLLPYIKAFHQEYPNIKIKIFTDPTFELIPKVRNGIIDFIILNLPYDIPLDFETKLLKEIHDCFVTSKVNEELLNKSIPLQDLDKYKLIFMAPGSNTRAFIDNFLLKQNISFTPDLELASYSLVTEFTKIGLGIGLVTKEYLDDELETGELLEIKTIPELPTRHIGTIYLKNKSLSCAANVFLDYLFKDNK